MLMTPEHTHSLVALAVVLALSLFIAIRFRTDSLRSLVGVYIAAGFLWAAIRSLSPVDRSVSFISFLAAVFLMEQFSRASNVFLRHAIGRWTFVASIVAHIAILSAFSRLNLWRTMAAVAVYWFVILYFETLAVVVNRHGQNRRGLDRRTLGCVVVSSIAYIAIVLAFWRLSLWYVLAVMVVYPFVVISMLYTVAFVYRNFRSG
jgi:hypothetical protein